MNATEGKYVIIYGWMRDLDLTLAETMAYALVYGYAKNGEPFQGSITYMQQWLRCTRHTAINAMQALEEKGLLRKEQVMVKGSPNNRYYITEISTSAKNALVGSAEIALEVVQPLHQGSAKNALGVVQKIHHINNIDNNIIISHSQDARTREIETLKKWLRENAPGTESIVRRNEITIKDISIENLIEALNPYIERYYTEQLEFGKGNLGQRGRSDVLQHFAIRIQAYIAQEKKEKEQKTTIKQPLKPKANELTNEQFLAALD